MFLIPIAETNGLAYLGAFPQATLGHVHRASGRCVMLRVITDELGIQYFVTRVLVARSLGATAVRW